MALLMLCNLGYRTLHERSTIALSTLELIPILSNDIFNNSVEALQCKALTEENNTAFSLTPLPKVLITARLSRAF